jgi:hypothetical protein
LQEHGYVHHHLKWGSLGDEAIEGEAEVRGIRVPFGVEDRYFINLVASRPEEELVGLS